MKALVTGGARGIGAAIAERLRAEGMDVVVLDRDEPCDIRFDLASDDELPDLGDIDVCVSNAAITTTIAPAHRMTREQWQRDIDVNLTGAFRVIQACLTGMRERGFGRIVVISSGAARSGLPGQVAYAASKAGLVGLTKTIAAENAHRGITANAILPGLVASEMVLKMPPEILEAGRAAIPTKSLVEPREIADAVAYLAGEGARSITGEAISIDGGVHLNTRSLTRRRD
ncbi:MAG TPA: SDR family NAD(P)-dependent oxidoreductase [Solirubrobacteraceae bacterium]|jgi:NAD(P)-dependent dehydrogenase (short-subunit alcohol dehydrogenase family)